MNIFLPTKLRRGFTLIELLVVIGILTVLLAIVLVAINPARQFSQANDTQRRSDVNAILNAIHQYAADNKGTLPTDIATTSKVISSTATSALCGNLVPKYVADIPIDPTAGTESPAGSVCTDTGATYNSGYSVIKNADNRITVSATGEITTSISVTR
ncbi:type II secretion system protein [Candidatus Curtissbacteria bacterium]|nr:type II secretion system protein [Candidatus Curtissbacteria bacterium]